MSTTMRAKLQVGHVQATKDKDGNTTHELVNFHGVCKTSGYGTDGLDDDNNYATFSPGANLSINIANPALHGKLLVGEKYYVDFTPADAPAA
jgi:hypothetical protein